MTASSLITTTIVTSYILRIKKVEEMDRWNHSGALGSIQDLKCNLKKGLDRYKQYDKIIRGNVFPLCYWLKKKRHHCNFGIFLA